MILPKAKIPHSNRDSRDSTKQGEDLTKEAVSSEVEGANNMIKGLTTEAGASQEEAEGTTMAITVMAIPITLEVEVDPFKDDHGGRMVFNQEEGVMHRKREQETQSTGVYRSISIFVVYAEIKAITTTNAIPYNTWLMLYKANKHRAITLQIIHLNLTIIMINRLFRVGIPNP